MATLLALGASLLAGGAVSSACKKPSEISSDGTKSAAGATSASCSASEHAEPHIPPAPENGYVGGKMAVVKPTVSGKSSAPCKCPPGIPLCEC